VVAVLRPSADSAINLEVWLPPATEWNGKFQMVGNGGWGGSIQGLEGAMPEALRRGYATAGHDTGHRGGGEFALGHPEKVIDFAYRAVHEATVQSKALVNAFYERGPRFSYFNGCSLGGRQAVMEAQRYPDDFDGILAGAPANPHIALHAAGMARVVEVLRDPESGVPQPKQTLVARAIMNACDGLDGVKDNIISDPMACRFDPAMLRCKAGDQNDCLTAKQVETVRRNYAPVTTSLGAVVFPGKSFGGGRGIPTGENRPPEPLILDTFRYLAHQDRNWDWRRFDIDTDPDLARKNAGFVDAVNFDLSLFKQRGGKLLMYHGWSDPLIAPESSVNYHASVLQEMGSDQGSWLRLFMVPGMGHCSGGTGATGADWVSTLEQWRERGEAPDAIRASGMSAAGATMTRPLCPHPQRATYRGKGDVNKAENFVCKAPN
jgi:feruloyl esterase